MDDKTRAASTHSITVFLLFIFPRSVFGVPPLRLVQQAVALVIFCLFLWVFLELRKDGKKKKGDYRQYTIYNCMDGGKTRSPAQYNIIIRRRNLNRIWANVRCTLFSFRHFLLLSWWSECKRAFVIPFNVQMQMLPLPHKHTQHTLELNKKMHLCETVISLLRWFATSTGNSVRCVFPFADFAWHTNTLAVCSRLFVLFLR